MACVYPVILLHKDLSASNKPDRHDALAVGKKKPHKTWSLLGSLGSENSATS